MHAADAPSQALHPDTGEFETPLARVIGPGMLLVFIVGDVLGAGIYALVGVVAGETGGAIWTAFLLATVLALLTAFSYAELVTKYPHAGGAAVYVHSAFRKPFLTFVVAFAVMCSGIASAATLARAFAGDYLAEFVDLPVVLVAVGFLLVVALINFRGISESVRSTSSSPRSRCSAWRSSSRSVSSRSRTATGSRRATSSSRRGRASRS